MNINILDENFNAVALIDNYNSLIWCKRFYEVGALDLEVEASVENLRIFKKGYYITRSDDDAIFRIEAIEIETTQEHDNKLIIGAYDCKQILHQRITWSQIFLNNSDVQSFIRRMLLLNFINPTDTKRKINLQFDLNADLNGIGVATTRQSTYDDIGEKTIELCKSFNLGCKIYFDFETKTFHFKMFEGVDRSINQHTNPRIIFSPENDNLFTSKYTSDISDYKNVALVGGEGEGVDRKLRSVGNATGLARRELFIDAGSVSSDDGDLVDYYDALINEGKAKLAETPDKTSFEGEVDAINSYKYKTDYDLGDIVTIKNEYGIQIDARIVEIIETWDNEGYTIEPKFAYEENDVAINNAILTENDLLILTENGLPLLLE